MLKYILPFIFPVVISAGNISLSLQSHDGRSSYTVESPGENYLKSELLFPFNFYTISLDYTHNFNSFNVWTSVSLLLDSERRTGKDYDWQNNSLTVFSQSDNILDQYFDISIAISKSLSKNIDLFLRFKHKVINMSWLNTYEKDYIRDELKYLQKNTLKYQQKFHEYNLGFIYNSNISDILSYQISPSLVYAFINAKDTHVVREFYTLQNIQTLGYELEANITYKITENSDISILLSYIKIKDKNTNMDYYNSLNMHYLSYPSSYQYHDSGIRLSYKYNF